MAKNRYESASSQEKKNFTSLAKLVTDAGLKVSHRGLEGPATKGKYMFYLKDNNPGISHVEFVTNKDGEVLRTRVILVATRTRATLKSEFYAELKKKGTPMYGGIVLNWEKEEFTPESVLKQIATLAEASDKIDLTVPEKEEKVEEPKAEEVQAPSAEDVAKADIAAAQ